MGDHAAAGLEVGVDRDVHVAAEHDHLRGGVPHLGVQPVPLGREAVPAVVVGRGLGRVTQLQGAQRVDDVLGHLLAMDAREHRGAGHERPCARRLAQRLLDPAALVGAERAAPLGRYVAAVAVRPGLEEHEPHQVADRERPRERLAPAGPDRARRPVLPRPQRAVHPLRPGAVGLLAVVLGAAGPGVVGELVVVQGLPDRVPGVQGEQVGVAAVLRVAGHVVVEGHALLERLERPADVLAGRLGAARDLAGLVDVVAQVQHEVQVVAGGDPW